MPNELVAQDWIDAQKIGVLASVVLTCRKGVSLTVRQNLETRLGDLNGAVNDSTATTTTRKGVGLPRTAWELPQLIRPLPVRHRPRRKQPRHLPHYPSVVRFIYDNRFAIASQVQRRFPERFASLRTVQYQLGCLVELGYLRTAPVRSTSPNFPFVYYVAAKGARLLQEQFTYEPLGDDFVPESVRNSGVAIHSLLHELLTTEFMLSLQLAAASREDVQLIAPERRYYRRDKRLRFEAQGRQLSLVPDAGFLLSTQQPNGNRTALLHLVEMDNGTMPPRRILEKYQRYSDWSRSEEGRGYLKCLYRRTGCVTARPNFRLLTIAHDNRNSAGDVRRMANLVYAALDETVWSALRDRLWFTSVARLRSSPSHPESSGTPVWHRTRDIKPEIHLLQNANPTSSSARRRFAERLLRQLRLHSLFPSSTRED